MDPLVEEALRKKMLEQQKLADMQTQYAQADIAANQQAKLAEALSKGAASIGSIGGRTAKSGLEFAPSTSDAYLSAQKNKVIGAGNEADLAMMSQKSGEDDPNSEVSTSARAMIATYFPQMKNTPGFDRASAKQLKDMTPIFKEVMDKQQAQKETWTSTGKSDAQGNLIMVSNLGNTKIGPSIGRSPEQEQKIAAQKEKVEEAIYRRNILQENAMKLKDLIKKSGTFELLGPESSQMDSLLYQMAVDYAKMVDPSSVAREGEVAAAQKYMLPIKSWGGLGTSNETAIKLVDNYIKDLDKRMESRELAKTKNITPYSPSPEQSSGTAFGGGMDMSQEELNRLQELRAKHKGRTQ